MQNKAHLPLARSQKWIHAPQKSNKIEKNVKLSIDNGWSWRGKARELFRKLTFIKKSSRYNALQKV